MGLQVSTERPLAGFVVAGATGRPPPRVHPPAIPYAPPSNGVLQATSREPVVDEFRLFEVASVVARAILSNGAATAGQIAELESVVSADVVAWSPTIYATSRDELTAALLRGDDAISDVTVTLSAVDVIVSKVYVEWLLTGRFSSLCFVDDDLLVEPDGRRVVAAGVLVVTVQAGRVSAIRCYHDDVAVLEQILTVR